MEAQKKPPQDKPKGDDVQAKISELEAKLAQLTDIAGRAQAELQNAKIRMERDATEIRKFASEIFLMKLLPTIDNFQRAFSHLPEELKNNEWVKGIVAIEQDLMKQVKDAGLTKIEALGQTVDPNMHEVLVEGPGEKDTVIEVLEDGYELNGKILRPAKVKVGNGE